MRTARRIAALACLALAALSFTPAGAAAQAREVTGTYNTTIASPQGAVTAVIVLKRDNGIFSGTLAAEGFPVFPVKSVTTSDAGVAIVAGEASEAVTVTIKFLTADKVGGTVLYQGLEMVLEGTFRAK